MPLDVVLDTNIIFAALYSREGPSFRLLEMIGGNDFRVHLSVALMFQYEDVVKRDIAQFKIEEPTIDDILDYICQTAEHHKVFYLWRPFLTDAGDDMILDLAVTARCSHLVTYNLKHFKGVERTFGIQPVNPLQFLKVIGAVI